MIKYVPPYLVLLILFSVSFYNLSAQNRREFTNPILSGFYPDPSVCRVGDNYYLVNSTFAYYPGITIFKSKDLVNWKLIGYALNRPEQLDLDSAGVSRGLFAPSIRYHDGLFYITCTLVDKGGNFVVTAKNPAGPWSNPVWLRDINGIDPSLFFDDNNKAYIVYNSIPPNNKSLYQGHRTIRIREFDFVNLKTKGEEHIIVNGGTDISKKPVWIEAPHIFKLSSSGVPNPGKDGYYYLIDAQGGTAYNHSEVVFRSHNVFGSYIPYKNDPILTQRNLDPNRDNPITSTGHADFVRTQKGDWWVVFLGCRPYQPYEKDYYNTGRETFMAPVKWMNGWPVINPDYKEVQSHYPYPLKPYKLSGTIPHNGNLVYRDDFDSSKLNINWMFLRTVHEKWYNLSERSGFLSIKLRPETCAGNMNPSMLCHRQQNLKCSASAGMEFLPKAGNEKAGLLIFQNETHFYFLCKSLNGNEEVVQLYKSVDNPAAVDSMELLASYKLEQANANKEVNFKIEARGGTYSFMYGFENGDWKTLKDNVDGVYLSTAKAGGFVGCMFGLYATSLGKPSNNKAYFDWFEYKGNDDVYK
jgi:xylan 1,4-beta-xylosidase